MGIMRDQGCLTEPRTSPGAGRCQESAVSSAPSLGPGTCLSLGSRLWVPSLFVDDIAFSALVVLIPWGWLPWEVALR